MFKRLLPVLAAALIAGSAQAAPDTLDAIATDFVKLSLEAGVREDGYVDAYYGPAEWQEAAKKNPRDQATLRKDARALSARLAALPATADPLAQRRRVFMAGQLKAADTRLSMALGEKFKFADEAEGLFGIRPQLKPLSVYDPVLAKIEALVPGEGPLAERVDAFQNRFIIPTDRLDAVMRAGIAECRKRTAAHIALPADERFTLEFVKGKSWSGYNWYKGGATSLIQINTDLPIRISRAIDLGCHEGYPGHHALNMLLEQKLARGKGWIEYTVYPLYSPQSLIAEGTANYGIDLAFPLNDKISFERDVLFPLAGLDPATAATQVALGEATKDLAGARLTIAQMYLDGEIDRETAIGLAQKYQLISRARAEQSISFTETYRSYVINYGLGQDMSQAYVEAAAPDQAGRWKAFERLISEPTVPADLLKR
ncbi:hypothetical protein [Caulobacter sp. NIBR1757]|uniref:hypothetical protein n=1 Tax=Caulobacter sp. NIBR1757 TaxID=3016000 RepID=UPI0022F13F81|nr:hypothetical protein [Caulobacter sp. NIBR1757]WGM40571.1 hypothetical protein AMEJIAPC_03516 [Caulobacter sp. NIBR1757]